MSPRIILTVLACLSACPAGPGAYAQSPNEKAARVLEPLLKRPGSAPLFERFVNAWLDTGTLEDLGKFLGQRAAADPSTPNRLLLALFHSRQGEPVKALEQFRTALASDPGSADIWYQKALLESRTLDFDAAIASLGKCLAAKPATELSLQASQLLGRLLARAGRTDEAIKTWRALVASRPEDEELREDILELQIAESLWPAAQETAVQLVEKTADPYRRVLRRMRLGDVFDRSGQREKALDTFAECLRDTGAGSWLEKEILSQIEKLFRREDDLSGLRAYFAKLLPEHAQRAGLQRAQARLLMEAGETEAAIAAGRALMALSPGDRAVREEFIALLSGAGRSAEAIPQVEQLLVQSPDDLELRLTLADLKYAAKDTAGTLAELRTFEKKAGAKEGTSMRLAGLMDRYGLPDEAVKTLRAALALTDQPEARLMLASLLHKSGKKDEALAEWQRVTASGTLPVVQQAARAMQAHGETDGAWQLMQAAASKAESDPVFLTQLCTLADSPDRARAALASARRLVELARTASDLNNALDVAQRVVRLSEQADAVTAELAQTAATAQSLCFLATLREAARDTIGANVALEKAREVSPELALGQLVRLWTMRGDFAQAAASAELLYNSPGGRQGHLAEMLASLHQRAGNPEAALRWTQEWKKLVPGATAPVVAEAKLLESEGRDAEALTALRSAAGRFEGNEDIRARLAAMSMESGRTADALRLYSTLYEDAADLSAKMRWLQPWGETAQRAGQLDNLIAQFEDRRRENRESVVPLMALAELHRVADNYDARRKALTEAARLKPDDPEIALEIARLESREDNDEAAIQTLRPMLSRDNSGKVASLLADLLISSGQLDEGLKLLTEGTAASPAAVELTALSLARRGEEKLALTFLQPHLLTWPADWRLQFLAALLEWKTDNPDAAAARFLTLAGTTTPLARAGSSTATATTAQTYEAMVIRIMPPDVQRFFRLLLASSDMNGNNNPYYQGYGRQSVFTQLPADPDELQDRAAALLMEISKSATPEKQSQWTAELERRGFSSARLFPDIPPTRRLHPADRDFDFTMLLREHPDNRPLLAFAALATAYRQWNLPADTAMAEKVWIAFRQDAPLAALFLALPGAGRNDPRVAWEDELLATAENLEKAPPLLTLAVVRSAGLARSDDDYDDRNPLPAAWRQRLITLLERWRAAADASGGKRGYAESMRNYAFRGLAQEYVKTKAAAPLAALFDAEWRWQSSRPQSPPQVNSDEPLAQPLGFPPWFLPGLPDTLRDFMQRSLTPEAAALAAPLVQEPLLRLMLTSKTPGAFTDTALNEKQTAGATTAVPFIVAASWAEKRGDFTAAAEHAVKALYLPVSQEARRRLDGALAYWASRKSKPGDTLHTAGREAALRLRRDAVNEQRRAELATLMDRLGLTEEADRLMRQGKAAESAGGSPAERLARLLDDGKHREAMPLLLSDIRSWTRQRLNNASTPSRELLAHWRSQVQVNGLLPQVMQALLPPQATGQQTAEFAAACELTGDLSQARKFYELALAGGVRKKVPQLLLNLVIRDDEPRAVTLLREFPELWNDSPARGWMRSKYCQDGQRATLEETNSLIGFLEHALDVIPAGMASDFPVAISLELAGNETWGGEFYSVPEVEYPLKLQTRTSVPPPGEEKARIEALAAVRIASFERLARRFIALPGCGTETWPHLEAVWTAQKKNPAELLTDGMAMLVRELKTPPSKKRNSDGDAGLQGICFGLMQQAAKAGRNAEFSQSVVPAIRAARSPLAAAKFLESWPLYEAPPEQFDAVARAQLKARGTVAWKEIIEAAVFRKLGADLTVELLAHYSHPDPKSSENNDYQFGEWCVWLLEARGRAAAEEFFNGVMTALLGPVAERDAFFKNRKSPRMESAQRILGNLAGMEAWTGSAMRFLRDEFLPHAPKELAESIIADYFSEQTCSRPLFALIADEKLAEARSYLDSLPMTEDLPVFFSGGGEIMVNVAQTLMELPAEKLAALGLDEGEGLTFGRRLLRGAIKGWLTGVCQEMAPWQGRIEALPQPKRERVLEDIRSFRGVLMDDAPPEARAFRAWLLKEQDTRAKAELEKSITRFLKDAAEGTMESEDALVSRLKMLLHSMAEMQHPRGREVITAARKVEEGFGTQDNTSGLLEMMMEQLGDYRELQSHENAPWLTGLIAGALREGLPPAEAYGNRAGVFGQALLNSDDDTVEGRLDQCLSRLAPFLQPGEARVVTLWLINAIPGEYTDRHLTAGLHWVEAQRGRHLHEELRHDMEMALRFQITRGDESKTRGLTDENALPVEQRHYLAQLRDESLPGPLRLTMGSSLLELGRGVVEPPLVHEVARQLLKSLTDRQPVTPEQEAHVFTALATLPAPSRDKALTKSLLPLTTLPRLRGDPDNYEITTGHVALMDLALRAGDAGTVDRLLEMDGRFPGLAAIAVLARHGEKQRLADLLKRKPEVLESGDDAYGTLSTWDAVLQSQLPAALESIADPVVRFETLTRLSMFNDPEPLPAGLKPRAARTAELAAACAAVPWRSPAVRDRVMDLLVQWNEPEPDNLVPALGEAAARVAVTALPFLDEKTLPRSTGFHAALIGRAAVTGNLEPLHFALDALRLEVPGRDNEFNNCRNTIVSLTSQRLLAAWPEMSAETRAAVCAGWRELLAGPDLRPWRNWPEQWHFALLLHGLAGRMDELTAWHAALPEVERCVIRDALDSKTPGDLLYHYRDQVENMPGTPEEQSARRASLFTALTLNPLGAGPGLELDKDYLSVAGTTPAEFLKLEEPLTRSRPDDVWLGLAFIRTYAMTGAWDKVLERTGAALAKVKPERETAYAPLLELRTLALEHAGRGAEALPEIKTLPVLPERRFNSQTATLSRAAQTRLMRRLPKP